MYIFTRDAHCLFLIYFNMVARDFKTHTFTVLRLNCAVELLSVLKPSQYKNVCAYIQITRRV